MRTAGKGHELAGAEQVLAAGPLATRDALLTQRMLSEQLVAGGGDYLLPVDENQPARLADSRAAFSLWGLGADPAPAAWQPAPWLAQDLAERGGRLRWSTQREPQARHGRRETRRLWALADPALNRYVGSSGEQGTHWPHLQPVCRIKRERVHVRGGQVLKREVAVTYAITSRDPARATAAELLRANRCQGMIENGSHWVRDVVLGEDACRIRSRAAPQAMAACRHLVLALLRRAGSSGARPRCAPSPLVQPPPSPSSQPFPQPRW